MSSEEQVRTAQKIDTEAKRCLDEISSVIGSELGRLIPMLQAAHFPFHKLYSNSKDNTAYH
jgi:hypothetical protein